ncbi:hypothetical protein P7K49_012186 [Saguinus oedipus]|uniref:Uncharacterized protein n=1 Tax=Saguinus oedipus TaxID=9490 RepID=A0ABQ9VSR9_SAGOE|nr:hypothetical protein P7K49_012186 [Saguinus oedipus]
MQKDPSEPGPRDLSFHTPCTRGSWDRLAPGTGGVGIGVHRHAGLPVGFPGLVTGNSSKPLHHLWPGSTQSLEPAVPGASSSDANPGEFLSNKRSKFCSNLMSLTPGALAELGPHTVYSLKPRSRTRPAPLVPGAPQLPTS